MSKSIISEKLIVTQKSSDNNHTWTNGYIVGNYNESSSCYKELIDQAKKDFPFLTDEIIMIGKIQESHYNRNYIVIHFSLPENAHLDGYWQFKRLPFSI